MKFSILVLTYNRPELLSATLKSLSLQTYRNFSVHLVDNGSNPPVDIKELPGDLDLTYSRFETNQHPCDASNAGLKYLQGTHFAILADDDVWSPHTLEIVAEIFSRDAGIESLSTGLNRYDYHSNRPLYGRAFLEQFNGHLYAFDGMQTGLAHCNFWGIGPKNDFPMPRMAHPSASFYKRELIERTIAKQQELYVKPFGDVGYLGCCFNTAKIHYLDLPLAVLGQSQVSELNGARPGQRQHWLREVSFLEHSPLKGCSFINMGVDGHLKVLHRNGVTDKHDCNLRAEFFIRHLSQVATDEPWTDATLGDLREAMPLAVEKILQERGLAGTKASKAITDHLWKELEAIRDKKVAANSYAPPVQSAKDLPHFDHILDYAVWQEERFALPKYHPVRRGEEDERRGEMSQKKKHSGAPAIPITFLMSVYNEESRIHYALEHAIQWADEIIVVNKSSTDRTREICESYGDRVKVVDIPFTPRGKNDAVALSRLPKNDWAFYGTASEIPTRKLIERAREILNERNGELDLVYVPRKMYSLGVHSPKSPWYVSYYPFLVNRKRAIITNVIHHNYRPHDQQHAARIEFAEDCCVYHCTHPSAKDYLLDMTEYFEAEAEACQNPDAKIKECFASIAHFEKQLREGGKDLMGAYCAWPIYQLGTILFIWEKQRGMNVQEYYKQLKDEVLEREWKSVDKSKRTGVKAAKTKPEVLSADPLEQDHTASSQEIYQAIQPLVQGGKHDEAILALKKLVKKFPDYALAHNDLGVLYYSKGKKQEALQHYQQAAQLNPANATFQKNLADFYYAELGNVEEALKIYHEILKAQPGDIETLQMVGHICVSLKKFEDAKSFYRKVLEFEPGNDMARENLDALLAHEEQMTAPVDTAQIDSGDNGTDVTSKDAYLVSALVSTYNSERFIRGCLEDLEAQTIADKLEIIVIDSASEQDEKAVVEEFQKSYNNIVYVRTEERETVYAAWNRGLKMARGKYVTNANTDDRHRKDALEVMCNVLEQDSKIGLVYANLIITDTENETFEKRTPVGTFRWHEFNREVLVFGCFIGPQPMWRKSLHDKYGYFDVQFISSGDWEFWLRIADETEFYHIPDYLGLYLRSPQSIEHRNLERRKEEDQSIFNKYSEKYLRGNVEAMQTALDKFLEIDPRHPAIVSLRHAIAQIAPADGKNGKHKDQVEQATLQVPEDELSPLERMQKRPIVSGLVSIIIAVPQHGKRIQECIKSIQQHTPQPHELIFVTSRTNGTTVDWLKKLIQGNHNYKLLHCDKALRTAAYNRGMIESFGEYLLLLDGETTVTEGWLTGMLQCLSSVPDVGVVGPMSDGCTGLQRTFSPEMSSSEEIESFAKAFWAKNRHRRVPTKRLADFCLLVKRTLVEKIGLLDQSLGMLAADDYCLSAAMQGFSCLISGDVFVHHKEITITINGEKKAFADKWNAVAASEMGKKLISLKSIEKAEELYQKEDIDHAVEQYLEAIKYSSGSFGPYYSFAQALLDAQHYKDAFDVLKQIPTNGHDVRKWELSACCKFGMELYAEAEEYANRMLAENPNLAMSLNLKGLLASKRGENLAAADFFKAAIASDPGWGVPYANLAELQWDAGEKEEALNLFEKGFILSPTMVDVVTIYHAAITDVNGFARAERNFSEASVLYPHNRRLRFLLIDLLVKQGKYDLAIEEIEQAVFRFGTNDGFLNAAMAVREKSAEMKRESKLNEKARLSLCMIVKNEEKHLARCLISVKDIVDEIIVVDTGSTDYTKNIAQVFGAMIYDHKWNEDFSEARNFALSKASGDWILVLDADEVLANSDCSRLRKLIDGHKQNPVAYSFDTRNYTTRANTIGWHANVGQYPVEEAGIGWISSVKVRLFSNRQNIRFEYPVHEMVDPCLKRMRIEIKRCTIPIHHYGKLYSEKSADKSEAYYQLGRKKLEKMGDDLVAVRELAVQAGLMGKYDEAIELWERVLTLQPDLPEAFVNLGTAFWHTGRYQEALRAARKGVELAPKMKEAHYNYAISELHLGNASKAISILERLKMRLPEYLPARFMLAEAYFCDGRKQEGMEGLKQMRQTTMGPGLPAACLELAKGLLAAQQKEYALAVLNGAIATNNVTKDTLALVSQCLKEPVEIEEGILSF